MHEMSICESILQIMEDQAQAQNFTKIEKVRLEIGPFSGVELEALRFGFEVVTRNTLAENCVLEIIETKGQAWCMECADTVQINERYEACPKCGGHQLQVSSGDELRIKDMEVN
ncbi:hydrogenase maturation nickel metallochaperone HypA [Terasakiella pusilla]|jgi:hydrogenase nickel incorporation protein HypA/HybF|uniref:hydrogenase maturation nickel metallochaperone HypA n=1 Tax=Terasakiella pusilla TaxID=64973 RepID=UPI00049052B4|nr:hydrogenase maturation nickel metallochaperone HypA [Terasakiella pusilla]